jgi:hypothetical protein
MSRTHSCMARAHPKEMVFVLLSRDAAAPHAIREWACRRIALGKNSASDTQIVEALACADTMEKEGRYWAELPTMIGLIGQLREALKLAHADVEVYSPGSHDKVKAALAGSSDYEEFESKWDLYTVQP